jgi:hypothetical protein
VKESLRHQNSRTRRRNSPIVVPGGDRCFHQRMLSEILGRS